MNTQSLDQSTSLNRRIRFAAVKFLEGREYEVVTDNFDGFIVSKGENGHIVFSFLKKRDSFEEHSKMTQGIYDAFVATAIKFFAKNDELADIPFRLDIITFVVLDEGRALIEHHINVSSNPIEAEV